MLGLSRFFDETVTYGEAEHNKPEPHPYLLAAERLGVDVTDSVVVEDSGSGIKSGLAAGAKVVAIATTASVEKLLATGAHHVVEDWPRLTEQITQLAET